MSFDKALIKIKVDEAKRLATRLHELQEEVEKLVTGCHCRDWHGRPMLVKSVTAHTPVGLFFEGAILTKAGKPHGRTHAGRRADEGVYDLEPGDRK